MPTITQQQIDNGAAELSKELKVDAKYLTYTDKMDCTCLHKGKYLLCYNIMDANHVKYKSTVTTELFI